MNKIPDHIVEEIFQVSRIEEVIGDFVQLKKTGSNLKGLSPFNDEKTPSFVVSPAKQIFKCFSSGKGGTVVTFLMEMEHFSYPEALRWLANKYGIVLPEERELSADEIAFKNERDSLFIINEFALKYFNENLTKNKEGKAIGLSYLKERGYSEETIEHFQLGYSIADFQDFYNVAINKGLKKEFLLSTGLVKESNNKVFDFFKGRVMFPIHSITGRVLGFGGRILTNEKNVAKYFNSPESAIYNKSKILYGMYFAKSDILKLDECFLCEGYTDVISLHQAGIKNVVSSSGTALTKDQIRLISRYTQNITILYDGDNAGIKASFRGIDLILEEGLTVSVVLFPHGEDPDSYSRKINTEDLKVYLANEKEDFISFKSKILFKEGKSDPIGKTKLVKELVNTISLIPDSITRSIYLKEIAHQFDLTESILMQELIKLKRGAVSTSNQNTDNLQTKIEPVATKSKVVETDASLLHEKEIIRLLLLYGKNNVPIQTSDKEAVTEMSIIQLIVEELEIDELVFTNKLYESIYESFKSGLKENILYSIDYFKTFEDQEIVKLVSDLENLNADLSLNWVNKYNIYTKVESDNLYETTMNVIYFFKLSVIQSRLNDVKRLLAEENINHEDTLLLLSEQVAYEKIKQELTNKLGRTILR